MTSVGSCGGSWGVAPARRVSNMQVSGGVAVSRRTQVEHRWGLRTGHST